MCRATSSRTANGAIGRAFPVRGPVGRTIGRMLGSVKQGLVRVGRVARPGNRWQHGAGRFAMYWHAGEPNFGDVLSPLIFDAHLPGSPRWASATFAAKVVGLGSIAHTISAGDLVVGCGSIDGAPARLPARTRVLAVRGPRAVGSVKTLL